MSSEHHVAWAHLLFYGFIAVAVVAVGAFAIWSFVQRQNLVVVPEALPKVTVVTGDANSPAAAAWVKLLTDAELSPTLVPLDTFNPIEGVVVFCDIETIPASLAARLAEFSRRGGAIAFVGQPPSTPIGNTRFVADRGRSGTTLRFSEAASPLLARVEPGRSLTVADSEVAFLRESPRMVVDARWENARAAVAHLEQDGSRYLWMGLDPTALSTDDAHLRLLLRSALRWVAGQPVSEGAAGERDAAHAFTPAARRAAAASRFTFSVDRTQSDGVLTVRMTNRGAARVANPSVMIWLPPGAQGAKLGGDLIMRRDATVAGRPVEGGCVVSLDELERGEERVLKLHVR